MKSYFGGNWQIEHALKYNYKKVFEFLIEYSKTTYPVPGTVVSVLSFFLHLRKPPINGDFSIIPKIQTSKMELEYDPFA